MPPPLVLALEADCLDPNVSIQEVLRKALVVARKLSLTDARTWIEKELNGYVENDEPPRHRLLTGEIVAWNPVQRRYIPVIFNDPKTTTHLSQCYAGQPIGELESLVRNQKGDLLFPFPPDVERDLMEGSDARLQPTRRLTYATVGGIVDAVRNMILNWCLQLEQDGILGEGMVFSVKEKETATHSNYTINYNGPVTHSQIQQGSPNAKQTMSVRGLDPKAVSNFIQLLRKHESDLKLKAPSQLEPEIQRVEVEIASPNPSENVLRESLQTIRNLIEGCASSLIASGLLHEIGKLLGH